MYAGAPPQLPHLLRRIGHIMAKDASSLVFIEARRRGAGLNASTDAKPEPMANTWAPSGSKGKPKRKDRREADWRRHAALGQSINLDQHPIYAMPQSRGERPKSGALCG